MIAIQPLEAWPEDDWFAVRCALLAVVGNTYRRVYKVLMHGPGGSVRFTIPRSACKTAKRQQESS
eukprot:12909839-Prorocentrum_lima.AAC.1